MIGGDPRGGSRRSGAMTAGTDGGTAGRGSAAAARHDGRAPIDLEHLARQTFGSTALRREVLRLFVGQGRGLVEKIASAPSARERGEWVHRLKGSAQAIGATDVGRLAAALETAAGEEAIADLVGELADAVAAVEAFVAILPARDA